MITTGLGGQLPPEVDVDDVVWAGAGAGAGAVWCTALRVR